MDADRHEDLADDELVVRLEQTGMCRSSALALVAHRDEPHNAEWIAEYLGRAA